MQTVPLTWLWMIILNSHNRLKI